MVTTMSSELKKAEPIPDNVLVRLRPVLEILQAVIWTGRLAGESPVSACLVADSQSAKSRAMQYFEPTPTLRYLTDVTSKGILAEVGQIERQQLRHLVLLDLHMVVSHNRYTTDRTLLTLGALMEEGAASIHDAGGEIRLRGMPKIGVIMATTPSYYYSRRGFWRSTGFLSRFLTIQYSYSDETRHEIHEAIKNGVKLPDPRNEQLPPFPVYIEVPADPAEQIMRVSQVWGNREKDPAFRFHKQIRRLAQACALMDGRLQVSSDDVARIIDWTRFFGSEPVIL